MEVEKVLDDNINKVVKSCEQQSMWNGIESSFSIRYVSPQRERIKISVRESKRLKRKRKRKKELSVTSFVAKHNKKATKEYNDLRPARLCS